MNPPTTLWQREMPETDLRSSAAAVPQQPPAWLLIETNLCTALTVPSVSVSQSSSLPHTLLQGLHSKITHTLFPEGLSPELVDHRFLARGTMNATDQARLTSSHTQNTHDNMWTQPPHLYRIQILWKYITPQNVNEKQRSLMWPEMSNGNLLTAQFLAILSSPFNQHKITKLVDLLPQVFYVRPV